MSTNRDDIQVRIAGDLADINRSLKDLKTQARAAGREAARSSRDWNQLGRGLDTIRNRVKGIVAAYIGFRAVTGIFRGVTRNTIEQERALAQLDATLRSTAGAAGLTRDELVGMSTDLQDITKFGDEAILGMENLLLTFTNIRSDVFRDAAEAVLDMSTALDDGLEPAAIRIGKALNDPLRGMSELREVGIAFTDDQIALSKRLVETGDLLGAQRIILDELQREFGGSARAARDTFGGALASLKNAAGDLLEGRGGNLNDAQVAIEDLTQLLRDPQTIAAFQKITSLIIGMTGAVSQAVTGFVNLGRGIGEGFARFAGAGTPIDQAAKRIEFLQGQLAALRRQAEIAPGGSAEFYIRLYEAEIVELEKLVELNEDLARGREAARGRGTGSAEAAVPVVVDQRDALKSLQAQLAAAGVLLKDEIKRLGEALDREFELSLVSIRDYYRQRAELEQRAIDQQIESQRTVLQLLDEEIRLARNAGKVTIDNENKRAELVAEITVLEQQRAEVAVKAARDQADAERDLAEQLEQVRTRLLEVQGDTVGARTIQLESEFRKLLRRLQVEGDEEGEALVRQLIDVELAKSRLKQLEDEYARSLSVLSREEQRVQALVETGTITEREGRRRVIELHQETAREVGALIPFMRELAEATGDPQAIERLADLELQVEQLAAVVDRTAMQIRDGIQDAGESAFGSFIAGAQSAKDAWNSFVDDVKRRAGEIFAELALDRLFGGTGGAFGAIGSFLAGVFHEGGIAGQAHQVRRIPRLAFADAPRLHSGGLLPGETPAILKRGEEVLPTSDPRHRLNAGRGSVNVSIYPRDFESFRRASPDQIAAQIADQFIRARNRNR